MRPYTETNTHGQIILWRPHPLSEVMRAAGHDDFLLEPVLLSAPPADAPHFSITANQQGVSWQWQQHCVRVQARICRGQHSRIVTRRQPQSSFFGWPDLALGETVELIAYDNNNSHCGAVTLKIAPVDTLCATLAHVEFSYDSRQGIIAVSLSGGFQFCIWKAVHLNQGGQFRNLEQGNLENGITRFPAPAQDCLIAIINEGPPRQLLGYVRYYSRANRLAPLPADWRNWDTELYAEAQLLLAWSGTQEEERAWAASWPTRSRAVLQRLYYEARKIGLEYELHETLKENLTGWFRYLALRAVQSRILRGQEWAWQLDGMDFLASLRRLQPELNAAWPLLTGPEAQLWALQNAHNPYFPQVVREAQPKTVVELRRLLADYEERTIPRA